ncbi:MAG: class I SAM-dependent methyltransferase [Candidatus Lokiarchaeota archaeon]|nr:class I SAM-dependent methyltransferase [Candidatus Lokiarchaeota archaeon]
MKEISGTDQNKNEISMKDQMKKFLIKSLYGFLTVLMFGLGRRVGILDYLQEKAKSEYNTDKVSSVTFTIEEVSEKLNLERNYVDAWTHTALECGLLEIDDSCERCLRTAPYVYDLLINRNQPAYVGDPLGAFYYLASYQDLILDAFKKDGNVPNFEFTDEVIHDINRMSARFGTLIERIFSTNFKNFCEKLHNQGTILAAGCGYGYNLQVWAKKYDKARFVGIDIDPTAISHAKNMVEQNKWKDRIEIFQSQINEYAKKTEKKFDLILLNQVLHEMDHDINYRLSVFNSLCSLLKNDGILLVGESMIPETFAPSQKLLLFDVLHKFLEARFANFYNEKTFREFIDSTPFTRTEFIKEGGNSIWVIRK